MKIAIYLATFIAFELCLGIGLGKYLKRGQLEIE